LPVTATHGFVCLLAGPAPQPNSPWSTVWTTDGDQLAKGGKVYPLAAARTAMLADLRVGQAQLPFQVDGPVFWQVIAQPENRYIICLLDPGWVDPAPRTARVRAQLSGNWTATDRLTGHPLRSLGQGIEITVPAGTFRLIDVR
jgi:hypothetical protein